jgi:flagellar biosynthetic protein FliQ
MTVDGLVALGQEAMAVATLAALPILGVALLVGVLTSLVQVVIQIQDTTLSFVPKLVAVGIVLTLFGPWIVQNLLAFTSALLQALPRLVG